MQQAYESTSLGHRIVLSSKGTCKIDHKTRTFWKKLPSWQFLKESQCVQYKHLMGLVGTPLLLLLWDWGFPVAQLMFVLMQRCAIGTLGMSCVFVAWYAGYACCVYVFKVCLSLLWKFVVLEPERLQVSSVLVQVLDKEIKKCRCYESMCSLHWFLSRGVADYHWFVVVCDFGVFPTNLAD